MLSIFILTMVLPVFAKHKHSITDLVKIHVDVMKSKLIAPHSYSLYCKSGKHTICQSQFSHRIVINYTNYIPWMCNNFNLIFLIQQKNYQKTFHMYDPEINVNIETAQFTSVFNANVQLGEKVCKLLEP